MRRTAAALTALTIAAGPALATEPGQSIDPTAAPAPAILIAQSGIDDLDAMDAQEETLEFLIEKEFNESAQSLGAAVGLSLIPGAGWGLMYADKSAQSTVPFLLSAVGYSVGAMYMAGLFNEEATQICNHVRDGRVGFDECGYGDVVYDPNVDQIDNIDIDPRDNQNPPRAYFATKSDYEYATRGEDFDGTTTGLIILGSTYVVTTLIGAVWAGSTVYDFNEQLRKDIESTAAREAVVKADDVRAAEPEADALPPRPYFGYDGDRGVVGLVLDF